MVCLSTKPAPVYRPRRPRRSPLYLTIERYLPEFERIYGQRYAKNYGPWRPVIGDMARRFLRCGDLNYGPWRPVIGDMARRFLRCGDLHFGFARVRCLDCRHEMFVAFSCQQRCLCPSCHQKRTLLAAETISRTICEPVPHRQLVFTIPKRLRIYCRFDRSLLGRLARAAWLATVEVYQQVLGRREVKPGMVVGIQTFGQLIHYHPHIHAIATDGAFAPDGTFLCLPKIDKQRLLAAWQTKVFELFLTAGKIDQDAVDQMRSWPHSGFSADNSVYLPPGDTAGLDRLAQYMLRCPFSLARVVRLTDNGSVVYRAEGDQCRHFPGAASADLRSGPKRNFQVFNALDFLAEVTQHIPEKGEHLVRYYGWYSHRHRGIRAKLRKTNEPDRTSVDRSAIHDQKSVGGPRPGSVSTWARLIKRVYEVDPLVCPNCGGQMKIVSFIERCQADVIERILRHCGLWEGPLRTNAGPRSPPATSHRGPNESPDPQLIDPRFIPDPEFLESEYREAQAEASRASEASRELQLVLDPEFL